MQVRDGFLFLPASIVIALMSHLAIGPATGQSADKPAAIGQPADLVAVWVRIELGFGALPNGSW